MTRTGTEPKTLNGTAQTYVNDDADKLTSITQGRSTVKSFTYDTAERTTGVTVSGNTTSVAYDYENRITTITYPNSSTNTFTYNGWIRGWESDSGTKTHSRRRVCNRPCPQRLGSSTPGISERRSPRRSSITRLPAHERLVNTFQSTTDTRSTMRLSVDELVWLHADAV
jgi:YD repeat-containing protein